MTLAALVKRVTEAGAQCLERGGHPFALSDEAQLTRHVPTGPVVRCRLVDAALLQRSVSKRR